MAKPAIPSVPKEGEVRSRFDQAVKENIEVFRGDRGVKVVPLQTTATTAEIIAKINQLIALLQ